eukprot:3505594-Lingulodinium_polyedra.AAC.1
MSSSRRLRARRAFALPMERTHARRHAGNGAGCPGSSPPLAGVRQQPRRLPRQASPPPRTDAGLLAAGASA